MGKRVYKENEAVIVDGKGTFLSGSVNYSLDVEGFVRIQEKGVKAAIKLRWEKIENKEGNSFTDESHLREYLDEVFYYDNILGGHIIT